jgi:cytosine/adenosine deaminase-related metal-dependent hydrolase
LNLLKRFGLAATAVPAALLLPWTAVAGTTVHYDWLTQGEVSGRLELTIHESGVRSAQFEFSDRGRGPKLAERYAVNEEGLITTFESRGNAYMGAPVAELFLHKEGVAEWQSTLESGSRKSPLHAFYLANDGTPEQMAALARALLAAPDQRLELLPGGEARIERLADEEVTSADQTRRVSLYAIHGLGFGPSHLWLDEDRELFALALGWMGLTPTGWAEVLPRLDARQQAAAREAQRTLATELTHVLPEAYCLSGFSVLDLDTDAGNMLRGHTVRVEQGRIAAVGSDGDIDCAGVPVIEGEGRTLLPGLWDMHVHIRMEEGPLHIAAGVTSVRDLANDHDRLMEAIALFENGAAIGPTVYRAGFIDARGPYAAPTGNLAESLEEALEFIGKLDEQGYPHIKIYSSIRPEWVAPMAAEMQRRGITLSGHIPSGMSAAQAVAAGFDEIQHINMVFLNFLAGPEDDTRTPVRFSLVAERGAELDLDSEEVAAFIELLKERGTVVDPTVTIFDDMFRHRSGKISPAYAMIADHLPPSVRRSMLSGMLDVNDDNAARYAASADALLAMIRKLHQSGIPLVAGTDALAGFTLHRELELYAKAGIPNADVLRIVAIGSAKVAGVDDRVGRIAPGYAADLIAVEGNPLEDISAVRRVAATITRGHLYQPAALYRGLGIRPFVDALESPASKRP